MASYDLTSHALLGDWNGVAEGAGGLVGGLAAAKLGQSYFAPEPGAQLGVYRPKAEVGINDPSGTVPTLPGSHAANFNWAEPVQLGGRTLSRVFDNVKAYENGGYWGEETYSSEGSWRGGLAVPKAADWNNGTLQGEWQPSGGSGWGGPAAPQAVPGASYKSPGGTYRYGWIQPGGDYQIWVPNSRAVIPSGAVTSGPTPWKK